MAARHLQALQLEPDRIEIAADFFEAYASFVQSSSSDLTRENALMDAASSLRAAGQWAILLDPERAVSLFRVSAQIWHRMGYGFGTFLLAAFAPGELSYGEMVDRLNRIAQPYTQDNIQADSQQGLLEPLLYPQQQVYLLLAETGMSRQMDLPAGVIRSFADQSPHRRGVAPVGSLGTPLRVYWDIARHFLDSNDDRTAALVARTLSEMARSYAEAIDSAMANERLWFNAASPVDVGNIDTAAISMVAARRLGFDLTRQHLESVTDNLNPIARVPLELAIEMIDRYQPGPEGTSAYA
jgi:hypothetical protein